MLYLFIFALLAIGTKSICNLIADTCAGYGQGCIDYFDTENGINSQTCGCYTISDCYPEIVKDTYSSYGDVTVACYDAGEPDGEPLGYNVCAPVLCSSSDDCNDPNSICDTASGFCLDSSDTADCILNGCSSEQAAVCDADSGDCVECQSDTDCDAYWAPLGYSICNTDSGECVECLEQSDCGTRYADTCETTFGFCYIGCDFASDCESKLRGLYPSDGKPTCEEQAYGNDTIMACECEDCIFPTTEEPMTTSDRKYYFYHMYI